MNARPTADAPFLRLSTALSLAPTSPDHDAVHLLMLATLGKQLNDAERARCYGWLADQLNA